MSARRVNRPSRGSPSRRRGRDPGGRFLTAERRGRNILIVVALVAAVVVVVTTWLLSRRADDPKLQQVDVPTSAVPAGEGLGGPSDSERVGGLSGDSGQVAAGELAAARTKVDGAVPSPVTVPPTTASAPTTVPPTTVSAPTTVPPTTVSAPTTVPPTTAGEGELGTVAPADPSAGVLDASSLAGPAFYRLFREDGHSLLRAPSADDPLRMWVGGDSLSGAVADELERYAASDPLLTVTKETRTSTGVVSEWFFDWRARITEVAAGGYDVIVLTMGGNDAQQFRGIPARVASDEWRAEYRRRVASMLRTAARPGRLVIWIGMAPATPPNIAPLMPVVDEITSSVAAETDGVAYLDAWSMFAGPDGQFLRSIVTPEGRSVRVRADDGVHYTLAAGRMLRDGVLQLVAGNVDSGAYPAGAGGAAAG